MSDFLFDLGNTRLKFAAADAPDAVTAMAHDDRARIELPVNVRGDAAWVASVAPDALTMALMSMLSERFTRIHRVRTPASFAEWTNAYPEPASLGVDRFLSMIACMPRARPSLLVSVGTGLTVDAVLPPARHLGGVIAPSPTLMREALFSVSPRLPATGGTRVLFADNTRDALASGCEHAALALVSTLRTAFARQVDAPVDCVLHGGGAQALADGLEDVEVVHDLVLRGLAVWRARLTPPRMGP